jgi:hypothetical protein
MLTMDPPPETGSLEQDWDALEADLGRIFAEGAENADRPYEPPELSPEEERAARRLNEASARYPGYRDMFAVADSHAALPVAGRPELAPGRRQRPRERRPGHHRLRARRSSAASRDGPSELGGEPAKPGALLGAIRCRCGAERAADAHPDRWLIVVRGGVLETAACPDRWGLS